MRTFRAFSSDVTAMSRAENPTTHTIRAEPPRGMDGLDTHGNHTSPDLTGPGLSRRGFLQASGVMLAMPAILKAAPAAAQADVTLRMHHFLPPVSNVHQRLLLPWAEKISQESNGKLKVEIFPAMQLGGKPAQLYDQAANGVVDIIWTLPGNTPGRFPTTEVFELPFIAARAASVNAPAFQEFAEKFLAKETADTRILCAWAHDHGPLHANKPIRTKEDLAGLKLRNPTRLAGEALAALGATPIGMPTPQVPEALAQRAIDGCVVPWEVVPSIKVDELTTHHTEIPGSPTLYTTTFFLAMNKAKYQGLASPLREVLDRNCGMTFARLAGTLWDTVGAEVRAAVMAKARDKGGVYSITEAEKARWIAATRPVQDRWIAGARARGLDGATLIQAAREAIDRQTRS